MPAKDGVMLATPREADVKSNYSVKLMVESLMWSITILTQILEVDARFITAI